VLILPGTVLGVLVAQRAVRAFMDYLNVLAAPQRVFFNVDLDAVTTAFAALIAALCALVFGFVPARQTSRVDLVPVINQDVSSRGAPRGRLRTGLVTAQVAVSMVLLIGAGLVMRSIEAAARVHPGFEASHVARVRLDLQQHGYDERRGREFYRSLLDALRTDSGIESASLATYDPLHFAETPAAQLAIDGYVPQRGEEVTAQFNTIGTEYFRTLRIDLVSGREFGDHDTDSAAPVAIVNRTFAERFWGSVDSALGKQIRVSGDESRTVVGVAADVKYMRLDESPRPYFYLPLTQAYAPVVNLYAHSRTDAAALLDQTQAHIAALDPDFASWIPSPFTITRRAALWFFEMTAAMLLVFGAAGMALAAMGTYGLVSYTVTQQTREIGIRMALGATALAIVRAVVSRGLRLAATGAAIGLVAAVGATRLLGSILFGVSATDGLSFAGALATTFGAVIAATLVPAWRAARTNPLVAIRHQ
jgi:predicted permease